MPDQNDSMMSPQRRAAAAGGLVLHIAIDDDGDNACGCVCEIGRDHLFSEMEER